MINTDMCLFYQDNPSHAEWMKQNKRSPKKCKKMEKKGGFLNAKTSSCCAWTQFRVLEKFKITGGGTTYCGMDDADYNKILKMRRKDRPKGVSKKEMFRKPCCEDEMSGSMGDCDSFNWPKGPAMNYMLRLGGSVKGNEHFYAGFLKAWKYATDQGSDIKPLDGETSTVQLEDDSDIFEMEELSSDDFALPDDN